MSKEVVKELTPKYRDHNVRNVATPKDGFTYEKDEMLWKYREDGTRYLEKVGTVDTYLATQANAEQTDVKNIVRRATLGETDLLNKVQGQFVDTTMCPKSLMEAQNFMNRSEKLFGELPKEIRNSFGNDINQFMAEYGTEGFYNKIKQANTPKAKVIHENGQKKNLEVEE